MATVKLTYDGKVQDGKIALDYPYKFKHEVVGAFKDCALTITVERKRRKRALNQNAYYFGVVCALVRNGMNQFGSEYDIEETHEFLKSRFNVKEFVNGNTGEISKIPFSTTKLSTIEFMEYIERIQRFAAEELCIEIPDPNMPIAIHDTGVTVHDSITIS